MKNKKTKITKIISTVLLVVFSVLTMLLNFNFVKTELTEEQLLEITMAKEQETIENIAFFDTSKKTGQIETLDEFNEFRDYVNGSNGKTATTFSGYTINLLNDIDLKGEACEPIGTTTDSKTYCFFKGIFNGNGYAIKNLKIDTSDKNSAAVGCVGLFGYASNATIKNLTVTINSITEDNSDRCVGGLVGKAQGSIVISNVLILPASSDSYIKYNSSDTPIAYAGGIVGYLNTTSAKITQCANYVNIFIECKTKARAAGIVGASYIDQGKTGNITIAQCISAGAISVTGTGNYDKPSEVFIGGILGVNRIQTVGIYSCLNQASISVDASYTYSSDDPTYTYTSGSNESYLRDLNTDEDDIKISYSIERNSSSKTYNVYAGGICGHGGSLTTISYCANTISSDNISVPQDVYNYYICYFYGRNTDTISNYIVPNCWYGDYVEPYYDQYFSNYANLGYSCTITANSNFVSYKQSNTKIKTDSGYRVYDRTYMARLQFNYATTYNVSAVPISDIFKAPSTAYSYSYKTTPTKYSNFYDYKRTITANGFYQYSTQYNYSGTNSFYGAGYKYYSKSTIAYLPFYNTLKSSVMLVPVNYTSEGWYYGNLAISYSGYYSTPYGQLTYNTIKETELLLFAERDYLYSYPHTDSNVKSYSFGFYYTSNFNSNFLKVNADPGPYYSNNNKSVIKNNRIVSDIDQDTIRFIHRYAYDHNNFWGWWLDEVTDELQLGSTKIISGTTDSSSVKISDVNTAITELNKDSSYSNSWYVNSNSQLTLKWTEWSQNTQTPQ